MSLQPPAHHLLNLPQEIRDQILGHALHRRSAHITWVPSIVMNRASRQKELFDRASRARPRTKLLTVHPLNTTNHQTRPTASESAESRLNILLTCRQLAVEARPILIKNTTFNCKEACRPELPSQSNLLALLLYLGEDSRHVRSLVFISDVECSMIADSGEIVRATMDSSFVALAAKRLPNLHHLSITLKLSNIYRAHGYGQHHSVPRGNMANETTMEQVIESLAPLGSLRRINSSPLEIWVQRGESVCFSHSQLFWQVVDNIKEYMEGNMDQIMQDWAQRRRVRDDDALGDVLDETMDLPFDWHSMDEWEIECRNLLHIASRRTRCSQGPRVMALEELKVDEEEDNEDSDDR